MIISTRPSSKSRYRQGLASLWLILMLPLLFIMLCLVIEIGNLWLARMELEDAVEAAALAAVKEWGDALGGPTITAREVGREFGELNTVRGTSFTLDLNRTPAHINENTDPIDGAFIFGAITQMEPTVIFDANGTPPCAGIATIMADATGGNLGADDAWGISFQDVSVTGVTITQAVITLGPGIEFDFTSSPAVFSDNSGPKVKDNSSNSQPDNSGLTASDVTFFPTSGTSNTLTITFLPGSFAVDERFRFGALVVSNSGGGAIQNGDAVGAAGSTIEITLSDMSTQTSKYFDNKDFGSNDCLNPGDTTTTPGRVIVHPTMTLDLPCPETSAPNNNQQSYIVQQGGTGVAGEAYAVKASATVRVNGLCTSIFGVSPSPFSVSADATAMYDCTDQCPRLIRVDTFLP